MPPEHLKQEDIDFELAFYGGLIDKNPNFIEALVALGDLYTKAGLYKEGLVIDERLVQLKPEDPVVLYNLSCSYSLLKDIDKALRAFKKAINCGYLDFDYLEQDEDLSNLRKDRRFQKYLARVKSRKPSKSEE